MIELQNTSNRIKHFILKKFPLARKRGIKESDLLLDSGILDSLGVLELVHFVEEEFGVQVSDQELVAENFHSIDRFVSFLQSKTNPAG